MICETCQGKATILADIHDRKVTIPCYDCANRTLKRWREAHDPEVEVEFPCKDDKHPGRYTTR